MVMKLPCEQDIESFADLFRRRLDGSFGEERRVFFDGGGEERSASFRKARDLLN